MNIIKNENIEPYDVDNTLVMHQDVSTIPPGEKLLVYHTPTKKFVTVRINRPMVTLLKESFSRGFHVVVWSRGGWQWAVNVIKALDLVDHVHEVMTKPTKIFDDTPVQEWCTDRIYLGPDVVYKQQTIKKGDK